MRRAGLTTMAAALCAVATSTLPVAASPSSMSVGAQPIASKSSGSWTESLKFWQTESKPVPVARATPQTPLPSTKISPLKHPIQYFTAAMSETPVATSLNGDQTKRPAPERNDRIALNTPTGPATPQYFIALAQMSERQGNVIEARRQYQQALAMWPRDVEVLRSTARMEDRQGQLALAESLYQRAIAANPQHAGALNDLGLCLARQGKLEPSIQAIEQAIHLQPDKTLYRNNAATVLVEMRQDQKALAHLSAVHGPAVSNFNLGKLLVDRGRPHEAVGYFQFALELDPTMEAARAAIAQFCGTPAATQVAAESAVAPQPASTPLLEPQFVPQQPVTEPTIPATARGPSFGASSYVPPAMYDPASGGAVAPVYQTATAPRYLPPVRPLAPGAMVR